MPSKKRKRPSAKRPPRQGNDHLWSPVSLLRYAMTKVRSLRFAWGVVGSFATFAIMIRGGFAFWKTVIGSIVVLGLMVAYVLFDAITKQSKAQLRPAASLIKWTVAITFPLAIVLSIASVFWDFPKPIAAVFGYKVKPDVPERQQRNDDVSPPQVALSAKSWPLPSWTVTSGIYSTVSPTQIEGQSLLPSVERPVLHVTVDSAKVLTAASLGRISTADIENFEGCVPQLAAWGPLGELKKGINEVGASLLDVRICAYEVKRPGALLTGETLRVTARQRLEELRRNVNILTLTLQGSSCVECLAPHDGFTKEGYVLHLIDLAEEAAAVGRRYVAWESRNSAKSTDEECKIENILAEDGRVRRTMWDELQYLKRLEMTVLLRRSMPKPRADKTANNESLHAEKSVAAPRGILVAVASA